MYADLELYPYHNLVLLYHRRYYKILRLTMGNLSHRVSIVLFMNIVHALLLWKPFRFSIFRGVDLYFVVALGLLLLLILQMVIRFLVVSFWGI